MSDDNLTDPLPRSLVTTRAPVEAPAETLPAGGGRWLRDPVTGALTRDSGTEPYEHHAELLPSQPPVQD